ncbi:hypothetical protein [Vulcanisaeta souniana]|uniref:hypothetical protein n=1 Tax=Vulcanisaeta souniana TaxID=164452 RepID=UPI001FB29FD2|nr:hypothetical protein [Vulcanisaeta souniana]
MPRGVEEVMEVVLVVAGNEVVLVLVPREPRRLLRLYKLAVPGLVAWSAWVRVKVFTGLGFGFSMVWFPPLVLRVYSSMSWLGSSCKG